MASSKEDDSKPISSMATPIVPHYLPTPALDHAFSGIMAGAVATVCMNPLDLIKVQFQVDTSSKKTRRQTNLNTSHNNTASSSRIRPLARKFLGVDVANDMYSALRTIVQRDGWSGLYRGLSPNVVGNSASWGLYFLFYTMIKEQMSNRIQKNALKEGKQVEKLSPGQHLLAASESGALTALITNPIWVVKTRMFTTSKSGQPIYTPPQQISSTSSNGSLSAQSPQARSLSTAVALNGGRNAAHLENATIRPPPEPIRGLIHGIRQIWRQEGIRGLYKGGGLALFGVSNGAIQFMSYEELKRWRMDVQRRKMNEGLALSQQQNSQEAIKLDNIEYIIMSGMSKIVAIGTTYPYQVIRSRIQNHATAHLYPNIPTCIRLTFKHEGFRGFYKGMAANAVRIIPGTCVTFVVYENCAWALRGLAERRDARKISGSEDVQSAARIE